MDVSKKLHSIVVEEEVLNTEVNEVASQPVEARVAEGTELLDEVASLTGLPPDWVGAELKRIVGTSGHDSKNLTLDELRSAMLQYLDEMQAQLAEQEAADLDALEKMSIPGSTLDH